MKNREGKLLGHDLVSSFIATFEAGEMSITLLPKEESDLRFVSNWRGPITLGWLKNVSLFFNTNSLMDRYYQTFSFVSLKMISNKCPIITQQVVIICPT